MSIFRGANIVTNGLVFGYDDDIRGRFYKGEPTTNLVPFSEDFSKWGKGGIYTITSNSGKTPIDTDNATLLYTNTGSNIGINISCVNGNTYTFSFYAKKYDSSIIASETNVGALYSLNFNFDTLLLSGTGLNKTYTSVGNGWYRISYSVIATTSTTINYYLYGGSGYGSIGTSYIWGAQVELKSHMTQYIANGGTRSVTNSLIDLTKTYTIDLSNMSFNSNCSPTFNGTTNNITLSTSDFNKTNGNPLTIECVMKPGRLGGQYQDIIVNKSSLSYNWVLYQHFIDGSIQLQGQYENKSAYIPTIGIWIHVVATISTSGLYNLYVNGNIVQTIVNYAYYNATPSLLGIGMNGATSEPYLGDIRISKIYNKELLSSEVMQNYNAYKNRFSI